MSVLGIFLNLPIVNRDEVTRTGPSPPPPSTMLLPERLAATYATTGQNCTVCTAGVPELTEGQKILKSPGQKKTREIK